MQCCDKGSFAQCVLWLVQAECIANNPIAAGQERYQQMVTQLLTMGFERSKAQKALLVAHEEGLAGDRTLLRAVECLTQPQDSAALLC